MSGEHNLTEKTRLEALTDGMFAIAITLLVVEIRVPELHGYVSNDDLWNALVALKPLFLSYLLSFFVLFTYWTGHRFVVSLFAKGSSRKLILLNIPFLLTVVLVPFTSHLLGTFPYLQLSVILYSLHVMTISCCLIGLFNYVKYTDKIENQPIDPQEMRYVYLRIGLPLIFGIIAILISIYSPIFSIYVLVVAFAIALLPNTVRHIEKFLPTKKA